MEKTALDRYEGIDRGKRKAIAIDASYISKSGKKTPYIGKFWSGCASDAPRRTDTGQRDLEKQRG